MRRSIMKVKSLKFPEVLLIYSKVFTDERGTFSEVFNKSISDITDASFVQDNISKSSKHTLRGLHYDTKMSTGKLVRVIHGNILDCILDIRPNSRTYGEHTLVPMRPSLNQSLWIPPGFAHGFLSLEQESVVYYKTTTYYDPDCDGKINALDPALSIEWRSPHHNSTTWPLTQSPSDAEAPLLAEIKF